jgi:PTH1 family peptidyl-tRNA hydrolase
MVVLQSGGVPKFFIMPTVNATNSYKLICGLGNPETVAPRDSLHNVGFFAVEQFALSEASMPDWRQIDDALVCKLDTQSGPVILAKPYFPDINSSGIPLLAVMRDHGIAPSEVVVVHDDMDLDLGRIKLAAADNNPRHNGIKSVKQALGKDFLQVKAGVGRPPNKGANIIEWVAGRMPDSMLGPVQALSQRVAGVLGELRKLGLPAAQAKAKQASK